MLCITFYVLLSRWISIEADECFETLYFVRIPILYKSYLNHSNLEEHIFDAFLRIDNEYLPEELPFLS